MRVVLASGGGAVARAVRPAFDLDEVATVGLGELSEPDAFAWVHDVAADAVVCLPEWGRADDDEVRGVWWLARAAVHVDVPVVLLSSAEVFDGARRSERTESDLPAPVSPAGAAALAAEELVSESTRRGAIVRVGPLDVGAGSLRGLLTAVEGIAGGCDTEVTPLRASDVGVALRELTVGRRPGVWHLAAGQMSLGEAAARLGAAAPREGTMIAPPPLRGIKAEMVEMTPLPVWPPPGSDGAGGSR